MRSERYRDFEKRSVGTVFKNPSPYFSVCVSFRLKSNHKGSGTSMKITSVTGERRLGGSICASHIPCITHRYLKDRTTEKAWKKRLFCSLDTHAKDGYLSVHSPFYFERRRCIIGCGVHLGNNYIFHIL